jgi:hypothetical protein
MGAQHIVLRKVDGAEILLSRWTTMTPSGIAYWVSEFRDGPGQQGKGRVLYRSATAHPDSIEPVLRSDDIVEGLPIARPFGLDFSYQVSDNDEHLIQVVQRVTESSSNDSALYVDGELPLIEGQETAAGDRWSRFMRVAINDRGDYLLSGETDASISRDTVVAYNGEVVLREGEKIDGVVMAAQAAVLALSIDNEGRAVHLWSVGGFGAEYLFFACDASRLEESVLLLKTGEQLQLEDPELRLGVEQFNGVGHGPALWLGPGERLYAEVELADKVLE